MHIDPHAWLLTLPLTLALLRVVTLPADHRLKHLWRTLCERETLAWAWLGMQDPSTSIAWNLVTRIAVIAAIALLGIGSLLSLATFLGG